MILHKLNSTGEKALKDLSLIINDQDALILIEDAVYLPYFFLELLKPYHQFQIYILKEDLKIRGITQALNSDDFSFIVINYDEFVKLSLEYDKIISWF